MYEPEVNVKTEPKSTVPDDIRARFAEYRDRVVARTALAWGEHCTECNWPTCYTTCELYTPRTDGGCRLFVEGMVRVDDKNMLHPYLLKVRFKRWGKLWTPGNLRLYSLSRVAQKEKASMALGLVARNLPVPSSLRTKLLNKMGSIRRWRAKNGTPGSKAPNSFLLEVFNPGDQPVQLTFGIRHREVEGELYQIGGSEFYQKLIQLDPGFNRARIPVAEISSRIDLSKPFNVELVPNDAEDTLLYFGIMEFVKDVGVTNGASADKQQAKKLKCIVWDLDNTVWSGTLVEDGPESIEVREEVVDIIRRTDERGILHSIASKNNFDEGMRLLKELGLAKYFLYPQISWDPKSQSVSKIAQALNIGLDTLLFVDDQEFERAEVEMALPEVETLDSSESQSILQREECLGPVTDESRRRREMYREQEQRSQALQGFDGDYVRFLKACNIRLELFRLSEDNLERVYELAQRTNQMNFSGNRYPKEQLQELMAAEHLETYVMKCTDRFGSYGIVGFALVDKRQPKMLDLMFSCRIQSKRVEHGFLGYLLNHYREQGKSDFLAHYKKTERNSQSGKVFEEMGFEVVDEKDGTQLLSFRSDMKIPQAPISILPRF